jgi:hypothetical protein
MAGGRKNYRILLRHGCVDTFEQAGNAFMAKQHLKSSRCPYFSSNGMMAQVCLVDITLDGELVRHQRIYRVWYEKLYSAQQHG